MFATANTKTGLIIVTVEGVQVAERTTDLIAGDWTNANTRLLDQHVADKVLKGLGFTRKIVWTDDETGEQEIADWLFLPDTGLFHTDVEEA